MKNKKIALALSLGLLGLYSCKQTNEPSANNKPISVDSAVSGNENSSGKDLWAEQVESSTNLTVPDDWAPEDWNTVFKKIDRKSIYADIIDAVLSGKQPAYNFFSNSAYSVEEVKSLLHKTDSVYEENPATHKAERKIKKTDIGPENISLFRVREKVFFDKEKFKLIRVPSVLILYTNYYTDDGTFRGFKPLFYVKLNNS